MSKRHRTKEGSSTTALLEEVASSFQSDYIGTFTGDNALDIVENWIPSTNETVNYLAGDPRHGAFPQGRVIELFGPKSSAKSLIGYDAGANIQKMNGLFSLIDSEASYHKGFGQHIGIDHDKFLYAQLRTIEETMDYIIRVTERVRKKSQQPFLIMWDSLAATTTLRELDQDFEDSKSEMGERAKILSKGMREVGTLLSQENVTLMVINQIRKKIGVMYGKKETTPGGEAVPFHASLRLEVRRTKKITKGKKSGRKKIKRITGHKVLVYCEKNKCRPPFGTGEISIYVDRAAHRYGLDRFSGLTDVLVADGVLVEEGKKLVLVADTDVSFAPKDIAEYWPAILESLPKDLYEAPAERVDEEEGEEDEDTEDTD